MEGRIIVVALFCLLMAAACHETHLNGSTEAAFNASVQAMNQEHTVTEAQDFGTKLTAAEKKLGKDSVRQLMNGMSYGEAKTFLASSAAAPPATRK
ncbi:MAG: hypothetical protein ABW186_01490 [Rhodanobacteraceae bacterium]